MGGLGRSFPKPIFSDCAGQEEDLSGDSPYRYAAVLHSRYQVP